MQVPTTKVHNPAKPEQFLLVNESDVEEGGWVLWGEWPEEEHAGKAKTEARGHAGKAKP